MTQEDSDHFVSVRNLFAFLLQRPLVATKSSPTVFSVHLSIANQLRSLGFTNVDGSTYGEVVSTSLAYYIAELGLADVVSSREKTLEGIVLGERLRSVELYNEAFTHAVGKYEAIRDISSPIWDMISENTRNRLERAFMDLEQRQHSVQLRLGDFEFSSLFAGSAASTSSRASKVVRYKAWKSSFAAMRKHILSYYKDLHGDWPPKAKSKKNNFTQPGLNRLVLMSLYGDFCTLYGLLVDWESITTRSMDSEDVLPQDDENITASALRQILSEYDRSSPPVQPPVPFDLPKLPTLATLDPRHKEYSLKVQQQAENRKLQLHETILILTKSHNLESDLKTPFLEAFRAFEEKEAKGKTVQDLIDQRFGYWIFTYVVLQALPMLVIDAPNLRYTQGVEYFLCQPPKGGLPWMEDAISMQMAWYGVAGGSAVVALPSDIVHHGVEGIYRRSHCWTVAEKRLNAEHGPLDHSRSQTPPMNGAPDIPGMSPLEPPAPGFMIGTDFEALQKRQRASSLSIITESLSPPGTDESSGRSPRTQGLPSNTRARSSSNHRRSLGFGLEQLPLPVGYNMFPNSPNMSPRVSPPLLAGQWGGVVADDGFSPMSAASGDSQGKSFDEILNDLEKKKVKSKRRSFAVLLGSD